MGAQMFTAENELFVEQVRDWQMQGLVRRWGDLLDRDRTA